MTGERFAQFVAKIKRLEEARKRGTSDASKVDLNYGNFPVSDLELGC